ncbi:MAG: DUF4157 domain-containing protein, partial [Spirulinaceae cyanobacterium]
MWVFKGLVSRKKKGSRWKSPPVSQGIPDYLLREALSRKTEASESKNREETSEVQTKLTVGQPGDKYEQEADATAVKVVEQINAPATEAAVQSKVKPVAKATVMRQGGAGGGGVDSAVEQSVQGSRGSGQGLSEGIKEPMEEAFGANFSGVKVHTDGNANQLNRSLHSRAFATGQDIFFQQGEYNPESEGGQELIAHELTHVVQQGGAAEKQVQAKEEKTEEDTTVQKAQNTSENELTVPLLNSSELAINKVQLASDDSPNLNSYQNLIAQANTRIVIVPQGSAETLESSIRYAQEKLNITPGTCSPGHVGVIVRPSEQLNSNGTRTVKAVYGICGDSSENFEEQIEYFEQSNQITNNNDSEYIGELKIVLNEYAKPYGGWQNTPLWRQMSQIYGGITRYNGAGDLSQAILNTLVGRHLITKEELQERIRRKRNSRNEVNKLNQEITDLDEPVALSLRQDVTYRELFEGIVTDIEQSEGGSDKIRNINNKVNKIAAKFQHIQGNVDKAAIRNAVLVYWDSNAQQAVGGTPEQQPILQEYFENLPANDRDPNKGTQTNIRERALNIFEAVTNHRNPATEGEQKFYRALRNAVMVSYYPDITNRLQDGNIKGQIGQLNLPVQETLNVVSDLDSLPREQYPQVLEIGRLLEEVRPQELEVYQRAIEELNWNFEQLETSIQAYRQTRNSLDSSSEDSLDIDGLLAVNNTTEEDKPSLRQRFKDLIAAILGTVRHAPEVLGELWEEIKAQWPLFVALLVGLIVAEKLVLFLAATPEPTFLTKALAVALQGLIIAVYGASLAVSLKEGINSVIIGGRTAWRANGDPAQIEEASKTLLKGIGNLLLAVLSSYGLKRNISAGRWKALQEMLKRVKRNNPNLRLPDGTPTLHLVQDPNDPARYIFVPDNPPPSNPNSGGGLLPPTYKGPPINLPVPSPPPITFPGSSGNITPSSQAPIVPQTPTNPQPLNLPSVPSETPLPQPLQQPTNTEPAPFAEPEAPAQLDLLPPLSEPIQGIDLTPGVPETVAQPPSGQTSPPTPSDLEPLATLLGNVLGLSLSTQELQQASQGNFLTEVEIDLLVRNATNWSEVLGNYLAYPDLLREIISYRELVIFQTVTTVINNNPEFQELDVNVADENGVILGQLTDMVAAGSNDLTSDYDVTFSAGSGREDLEILAVEAFNQLFQSNWGRESGIVFDTNVY